MWLCSYKVGVQIFGFLRKHDYIMKSLCTVMFLYGCWLLSSFKPDIFAKAVAHVWRLNCGTMRNDWNLQIRERIKNQRTLERLLLLAELANMFMCLQRWSRNGVWSQSWTCYSAWEAGRSWTVTNGTRTGNSIGRTVCTASETLDTPSTTSWTSPLVSISKTPLSGLSM